MVTKNSRVVLITGGNKGLGKEIGRQLGLFGYTVVSLVTIARDQFPHGQLIHKGERMPW